GRELVATGSRTGREVRNRPAVQMGPETNTAYIKKMRIINTNCGGGSRGGGANFPDWGLFVRTLGVFLRRVGTKEEINEGENDQEGQAHDQVNAGVPPGFGGRGQNRD